MADFDDKGSVQPVLDRQSITDLFIRYVSDVYQAKQHLIAYLPWMVTRASTSKLRIALLNTSSEIRAELLRLEFICKILNCTIEDRDSPSRTQLNSEGMLRVQLMELDAKQADFALIAHMVFLESMEATSFQLLIRLARALRNKTVVDLLDANLVQAKINRDMLDDLVNSYLTSAA